MIWSLNENDDDEEDEISYKWWLKSDTEPLLKVFDTFLRHSKKLKMSVSSSVVSRRVARPKMKQLPDMI